MKSMVWEASSIRKGTDRAGANDFVGRKSTAKQPSVLLALLERNENVMGWWSIYTNNKPQPTPWEQFLLKIIPDRGIASEDSESKAVTQA